LWPISVFDGFYSEDEVKYYYPTNDLVTAPEIMFFWVARMIVAGYEYRGELPFRNVYYTGIVRDKQGRKMSKSLGNSPDPLELMKIYGADGVRVGMLFSSPAGNDLLFDESLCEQGRNFANKIWNAFRLVHGWKERLAVSDEPSEAAKIAVKWMDNRIDMVLVELQDHYEKFRINEALMASYKLVWDDFCSWYLEMIKPPFGGQIHPVILENTNKIFEKLLLILHPFMPFISEEIWSHLGQREEGTGSICLAQWPALNTPNKELQISFDVMAEIVNGVRNIRKSNQIPNKEAIQLLVVNGKSNKRDFDGVIGHLCNLSAIDYVDVKPNAAFSFIVNNSEYFIPFTANVDIAVEKAKMEEELNYARGFLKSVEAKLNNEKFANNAPAQVLDAERKKQADALAKIKMLEEKLTTLN
jgi:valyl-tRNA synthetase